MSVMSNPALALYPARQGSRPMTAEDLWRIPRVGSPIPAPNGELCAVTVTTYDLETNESKGRVWLVPATGGSIRAMTSGETSSAEPKFSPDGKWLAFTRKNEKKKAQLHVIPLDGGEARKLTDLPLGAFDPKWLPDGSGIVFGTMLIRGHFTPEATAQEIERREKDPVKAYVTEDRVFRFWDQWLTTGEVPHLFLYDLKTEALRDLTPESTVWFEWMDPSGQYDVSPDGREIVYGGIRVEEDRSLLRSALYTVPVAGGKPTCLTDDHPADDMRPRYTPDGKRIVYGMQHDPHFYADRVRIMAYDRATRAHTPLFESWDRSPSDWCFDPSGTLYLQTEDDARMSVFVWKGAGEPKRLLHAGTVSGLQASANALFFTLQNVSSPPEVHRANLDGQEVRKLSRFTESATASIALGEVREMRFEGAYGEPVQMFVVLPPGYQEGKKYPLIQQIHGGPHATSSDMFHFRWSSHAFAAPGYVVALVNFQGSTSWGQDYAERILGGWGDRPFQDVMLGTDTLIASGLVDEKRMAAAGGSYGGYMASWIEGHTDRFRCIVNHAGVYDTLSQYASDVTQGRHRSFGGEPWAGLERIDEYNPARFASGFKTPMLVIHGERDYRVPVTQGLECYGVLKAKGIPARLVYFPDENHWVLKPKNSLLWYREVLGWLERFLGKAERA